MTGGIPVTNAALIGARIHGAVGGGSYGVTLTERGSRSACDSGNDRHANAVDHCRRHGQAVAAIQQAVAQLDQVLDERLFGACEFVFFVVRGFGHWERCIDRCEGRRARARRKELS